MSVWTAIAGRVEQATGEPFRVDCQHSIGGGCINAAFRIDGLGRRYFVKTNGASKVEMFEAEFAGLREIAEAGVIRVPQPICAGVAGDTSYLVLEYLELGGGGSRTMERFGRELAQMHRVSRPQYGWFRDNTIGSTPQINTRESNWCEFWRRHRLGFQLELAARQGYRGRLQRAGEQLLARLDSFFADYEPEASLLHGDLWSGNYAIDRNGNPVIFDPAVYFGDREADLAMTELFGSFGQRFYASYAEVFPVDSGYRVRRDLYNLYHILNHVNLFGGGYLSQAEHILSKLLSDVR